MKMVMPFFKFKMAEATQVGRDALSVRLIFDEARVLEENRAYVLKACGLKELRVRSASEESEERNKAAEAGVKVDQATPGNPTWHYVVAQLEEGVQAMDIGK